MTTHQSARWGLDDTTKVLNRISTRLAHSYAGTFTA